MSTAPTLDPSDRREALATRLFTAVATSLELQTVYLGERLGLYRALADGGPATAPALAERAGIAPRYAREWLEQQAVAGILDVDDAAAAPDERRYTLPAGHDEVLLDPSSLWYGAGIIRFPVGSAQRLPDLLDAFRTGARHRLGALRAGRHRVAGGGQPAPVRAPGRRLDRRPARHRRAPAGRDRAGRRRRLRHGLVVHLDRPALPGRPCRRHRRRRGLDRAGRGATPRPPASRTGSPS